MHLGWVAKLLSNPAEVQRWPLIAPRQWIRVLGLVWASALIASQSAIGMQT